MSTSRSSWIRIVPAVEKRVVSHSTTPDHTRNPASVVMNEGTPSLVMIKAWSKPIAVVIATAREDAGPPGPTRVAWTLEQSHHDAADRGDEGNGQVDRDHLTVGDEQNEDDAHRQAPQPAPSAGGGW